MQTQTCPRICRRPPDGGYHLDLRPYGLGLEALIAPGETRATTDVDLAQSLARSLMASLANQLAPFGTPALRPVVVLTLGELAADGARLCAKRCRSTSALAQQNRAIRLVADVLGPDTALIDVGVGQVQHVVSVLAAPQAPSVRPLSPSTLFSVVSAMRRLHDDGVECGLIPDLKNPWVHAVRELRHRVRERRSEHRRMVGWRGAPEVLEPHEVAALIAACDSLSTPARPVRALVATVLLTGGRLAEVLALDLTAVDFAHATVVLRSAKSPRCARMVPLLPQLQRELLAYLAVRGTAPGPLFLPFAGNGQRASAPILRWLAAAARAAGIKKVVRLTTLRWTYFATRVQGLDGGTAVSPWVALRELGIWSATPPSWLMTTMPPLSPRGEMDERREH